MFCICVGVLFCGFRDSHFIGFQRQTEIGPSSFGGPFRSLPLLLAAEEPSSVVLQRSLPTKNITTSILLPGIPLSSFTLTGVHTCNNVVDIKRDARSTQPSAKILESSARSAK